MLPFAERQTFDSSSIHCLQFYFKPINGIKTQIISSTMIFTPTLKRKRGSQIKCSLNPLPHFSVDDPCVAVFNGFCVEVRNPDHIRELYDSGCFGKGSKSRSCPEFIKQKATDDEVDENLVLDLEEAFFLSHFLKVLKVEDCDGDLINSDKLLEKFVKIKPNFVDSIVAYIYLRSKNWVVKSGTKFGGNFLIYKRGPRFYHASFIVLINRGETQMPRDIKGLQRIAETSNKDLLFLEISAPPNCEKTLESLHKYLVSENIIKRFNYSAFVQQK